MVRETLIPIEKSSKSAELDREGDMGQARKMRGSFLSHIVLVAVRFSIGLVVAHDDRFRFDVPITRPWLHPCRHPVEVLLLNEALFQSPRWMAIMSRLQVP